ncbi:hypothetical protein AC1031_013015 [Aphanomyces cochlioides]|nr:hypothetical protein AC1031_013015 [Aphanomyces cochlioides]
MDQSLNEVIKSKQAVKRAPKIKEEPSSSQTLPSSGGGFSLGTSEQLGMSLDDLIASKRTSVKARVRAPVQGAKQKAAVQIARTKRQASLNQKRGLAQKSQEPLNVTISNRPTTARTPAARRRASHLSNNMLRRVNLGKRQAAKKEGTPQPKLLAWERHSRDHPAKFVLPQGTNFKISIDLNRVNPVVGIDTAEVPAVSLRK